jgi:hypothetical protein
MVVWLKVVLIFALMAWVADVCEWPGAIRLWNSRRTPPGRIVINRAVLARPRRTGRL